MAVKVLSPLHNKTKSGTEMRRLIAQTSFLTLFFSTGFDSTNSLSILTLAVIIILKSAKNRSNEKISLHGYWGYGYTSPPYIGKRYFNSFGIRCHIVVPWALF